MKIHLTLKLGIILTIALSNGASAAGFFGPQHEGPLLEFAATATRHFLNFRKETPLTAEQKEKVGAIVRGRRAEIRAQIQKLADARRAMDAAAKQHGADAPATLAAADAFGKAARDSALLAAQIQGEVRPLLTPEQQARIESARGEMQSLVDTAVANLPR